MSQLLMKNYRRITERVADKLSLAEIYGFYVLAFKSDYKTMESSVNEMTLAEILQISESTIKRWIKKYKELGLIQVQTGNIRKSNGQWVKKNHYRLCDDKYKLISDGLLELDISNEMKGFLILLKCRCYNCTNNLQYSQRNLESTVKISKSTINRYLIMAEECKFIKRDKEGITLLNEEIFIPHKESVYYAISKFYPEILTDYDIAEHRYFNTEKEYQDYIKAL